MQQVAHHLQIEAMRLVTASPEDADLYARSSFNRYYYATFLSVRRTLVKIDTKYEGSLNHKGIPELLRGVIQKKIKHVQKTATKLGDADLTRSCQHAASHNLAFASILEKAYALRVVADYAPGTPVDFRSARFSLSGVDVTEAHDWLAKANLWSFLVTEAIGGVSA